MSERLNFLKERSIAENEMKYQGNVTFEDGVPQYDLDPDMNDKRNHKEERQEYPEEQKELSDREANEKELIEIQKFVKLVMRTIFAVIIDVAAIVLTITCRVKNLFIIAILAGATILIAFYVYAIFVKIKEKKQAKENVAKKE